MDTKTILIIDPVSLDPIMEIEEDALTVNFENSQTEKGIMIKRFLTRISIPVFCLAISVFAIIVLIMKFTYNDNKFDIVLLITLLIASILIFGLISVFISSFWLKTISKLEDRS